MRITSRDFDATAEDIRLLTIAVVALAGAIVLAFCFGLAWAAEHEVCRIDAFRCLVG